MNELQKTLKHNAYAWQEEVKAAWTKGNEAGDGFAVGEKDQSLSQLARALEDLGYDVLSNNGADNPLVCADGERVIAIGDVYGPWAVDITDLIERD